MQTKNSNRKQRKTFLCECHLSVSKEKNTFEWQWQQILQQPIIKNVNKNFYYYNNNKHPTQISYMKSHFLSQNLNKLIIWKIWRFIGVRNEKI